MQTRWNVFAIETHFILMKLSPFSGGVESWTTFQVKHWTWKLQPIRVKYFLQHFIGLSLELRTLLDLTLGSHLDLLGWSLHIFRRAGFYPKWKTSTFWPGIKRLHQCQNGERRVLWSSQVHGSKGLCVIFCVSTYRMQKRSRQEGKSSFWYLIKK